MRIYLFAIICACQLGSASAHASTLQTVAVPHISVMTEKVAVGQTLIVKGSTFATSRSFTIEFHTPTTNGPADNLPLHISFRFYEGKVVINTFYNGKWGNHRASKSLPLKKGNSFDIRIRVLKNNFQILIDKKEFIQVKRHYPLSSITHLSIKGDVSLKDVQWERKKYEVPYLSVMTEKVDVGQTLIVKGSTFTNSRRFIIEFRATNSNFAVDDLPLHIAFMFDEGKLFANTFHNGKWDNHDVFGRLPLKKGDPFDVHIRILKNNLLILIDNQELMKVHHHYPLSSITHLSIKGDLMLKDVHWDGRK